MEKFENDAIAGNKPENNGKNMACRNVEFRETHIHSDK
jgi:hypothetical protein